MAPPFILERPKAKQICRGTSGLPSSTMKEEYLPPHICYESEPKQKFVRRERYKSQVVAEVTEQLEAEMNAAGEEQSYCTTYDDLFQIPGFELKDDIPLGDPEMHLKHPLYHSTPITYWTQRLESSGNRESCSLEKLTKIIDPTQPFKRDGSFTKPIQESYDDNY